MRWWHNDPRRIRKCGRYYESGCRKAELQLQQEPHRIYAEVICGNSAQALATSCAATLKASLRFSESVSPATHAIPTITQTTTVRTATTHKRCDPYTVHTTTFICPTKQFNCKDFTVHKPRYHEVHNAGPGWLWPGMRDSGSRIEGQSKLVTMHDL